MFYAFIKRGCPNRKQIYYGFKLNFRSNTSKISFNYISIVKKNSKETFLGKSFRLIAKMKTSAVHKIYTFCIRSK